MPAHESATIGTPVLAASRFAFIDNIRWAVIINVIILHAAVTYSHLGGWYYMDGADPSLPLKIAFAAFETFSQAYFMGFLFFIAGYFVPRAFGSKGPFRFLSDRAIRLGIPSLVFMLLIHPFVVYWLLRRFVHPDWPSFTAAYFPYIASGRFLSGTGPMWFAVALLIFCCVYALIGTFSKPAKNVPLPSHRSATAAILVIAIASFLVRIVQPIGTSVLNMQLCFFSQYIVLFSLGILAYRGDWLQKMPSSFGLLWLKLALFIGIPFWAVLIPLSGVVNGDKSLFGGLTWQSALFSLWESFFCVGVCLGLIVLFRDHFNRGNRFTDWLSRNSFTVYLIHTPILIAITIGLSHLDLPKGVKFLLASLFAVTITFAVSGFLRPRLPGLRRIL